MVSPETHSFHIPRGAKQQGEQIHGRQVQSPIVRDADQPTPGEYIAKAFSQLQRDIGDLAKGQLDETKVFDEYLTQGLAGYVTAQLTLSPTYEVTERIESIIITGPAGNVTLQLGDRNWSLTIPATGIITIGPVAIYLGRSDPRILVASTPGNYTLELMGHADSRWST